MVAPVYTAANAVSANGSGTFNVGLPSGSQVGDLILVHICANLSNANFSDPSVSAPSGYSQVRLTQATDGNGGYVKIRTYAKVLTAADISAVNVSIYIPTTVNFTAFLHGFRGSNMTVVASAEATQTNVAGPIDIPNAMSTRAEQMSIVVGAVRNTGVTLTLPGIYTQHDSGGTCPGVTGRRTALSTASGQAMGGGSITRSDTGATSAIVAQNIVIAAGTPPNAPTGLSVTGTALPGGGLDRTKTIRASWTVSDVENNAQTSATTRYRAAGSLSAWTEVPDADATTYYDFPANTFAGNVELAARTSDVDGTGPYSSAVTFYAGDPAGGATSTVPSRLDPANLLALAQSQRAISPAVP